MPDAPRKTYSSRRHSRAANETWRLVRERKVKTGHVQAHDKKENSHHPTIFQASFWFQSPCSISAFGVPNPSSGQNHRSSGQRKRTLTLTMQLASNSPSVEIECSVGQVLEGAEVWSEL